VNHKRGRPKSRRAGCLLCKPHKANGCKSKGHRREEQKLDRERFVTEMALLAGDVE
jgi:hypothetical protein